jgi:hypothetical protein
VRGIRYFGQAADSRELRSDLRLSMSAVMRSDMGNIDWLTVLCGVTCHYCTRRWGIGGYPVASFYKVRTYQYLPILTEKRNAHMNTPEKPAAIRAATSIIQMAQVPAFDFDDDTLPLNFFEPLLRRTMAQPKDTIYKSVTERKLALSALTRCTIESR